MADLSVVVTAATLALSEIVSPSGLTGHSRFYFPNSNAAAVSPSAGTSWNDTTQFDRVALARSHKNETGTTKTEVFNGTTPANVLIRQFVSEPLAAQTFGGAFKGQLQGITSQAAKLGSLAVAIRIVKNDGTDYNPVKTMRDVTFGDAVAAPPQFSTTLTNRSFNDISEHAPIGLTTVSVAAGDRLVVEIGVVDTTAHATRTLGVSFGGVTTTDLAEDNTTTTVNYPWIEFSQPILMDPLEILKLSDTVTAKRYGDATPANEVIHVSDQLTAVMDLIVNTTENVSVVDNGARGSGTTAANGTGSLTWSNTSGALLPDVSFANDLLTDGQTSAVLQVTNFGFSIPTNATITKVRVDILKYANTGTIFDATAQLIVGGSPTGHSRPNAATWPTTLAVLGVPYVEQVGSGEDPLWGLALTPAIINASDFGFALSVTSTGGVDVALVNHIKLTVYYTDVQRTDAPINASASETLHLRDGGVAQQDGVAQIEGFLRVIDGPPQAALVAGSGDLSTSLSETLKLSEQLFVTEDPLQAAPSEIVHIADTPFLTEDPLQATPSEIVHVSDTPFETLNPLQASPSEIVHVSDTPFETLDPEQASPTETLRLSDSVFTTLDPLQATPQETLKLSDTPFETLDPEQISLQEIVHVSDTVFASIDLNASLSELLHVSDTPFETLNPLQAGPSELVHVSDTPFETLDPLQTSQTETLKLSDVPFETLDPEQTSLQETLRISDTVLASRDLTVSGIDELVHVSDTVQIFENPLQATPSEIVHVSEQLSLTEDPLQATPSEVVHISDTPLTAEEVAAEILRLSDTVFTTLNPEQTSQQETIRISEELFANIGQGVAVIEQPLKISEQLFETLDPEQATPSETVRISDTPFVSVDLSTSLQETCHVSDSAACTLNPEQTTFGEALRITDSVFALLGDEIAVLSETLRLTDQLSVARDLEASLQETCHVTDSVFAASDLTAVLAEQLKLSDSIVITEDPLQAVAGETVHVTDSASAATDLSTAVSETVHVSDSVVALVFTPVVNRIRITGTSRPVIGIQGTSRTDIGMIGTSRPTISITGTFD